jgi:hypothetical protein
VVLGKLAELSWVKWVTAGLNPRVHLLLTINLAILDELFSTLSRWLSSDPLMGGLFPHYENQKRVYTLGHAVPQVLLHVLALRREYLKEGPIGKLFLLGSLMHMSVNLSLILILVVNNFCKPA